MKKLITLFLLFPFVTFAQKQKDINKPFFSLRENKLEMPMLKSNHLKKMSAVEAKPSLLNFNPVYPFDSLHPQMQFTFDTTNPVSVITVVTVYQEQQNQVEQGIWDISFANGQQSILSTRKSFNPEQISQYTQTGQKYPVINVITQTLTTGTDYTNISQIQLGKTTLENTTPLKGAVGDFLLFARHLNSFERLKLQSYLALKYGITLKGQNYYSSLGKDIYNTTDKQYIQAIAGLGRDDEYNLYQKQSQSTGEEPFLTISAGELFPSNADNPTMFEDQSFLVWGHNGQNLQLENQITNQVNLLQRKWKMQCKGNYDTLPTQVRITPTDSANNYYLVIDRSGTGNFAHASTEYIVPSEISPTGDVVFNNIYWDNDHSGSDIFTFSYGVDLITKIIQPSCFENNKGSLNIQVTAGIEPFHFLLKSNDGNYEKQWKSHNREETIKNLPSGNYTLWVSDLAKNTFKRNLTLEPSNLLQVQLEPIYTIDTIQTLVLDASKGLPKKYTYEWLENDKLISNNEVVTIHQQGNYLVNISDEKGCKTTVPIKVNQTNQLSEANVKGMIKTKTQADAETKTEVESKLKGFVYRLYPNPSDGKFTISINLPEISPLQIQIYDIKGSLVKTYQDNGKTQYELIDHISLAGTYVIKITTSYGTETFKLSIL